MRKLNVLIVDDEKSIVEILSRIVNENSNYKCDGCGSGEEAVVLVEKNNYDVVITDRKMAGLDGIEVLKRVKKIKPETEVVILTGFASMKNLVEAMKFEAFDYIQKPFRAENILSVLSKIAKMKDIIDGEEVESKNCK